MSINTTNISNFIAKIHLSKRGFLGIENTIDIILSPSLKIILINSNSKNNFIYKKGDTINSEEFIKWVNKNHYSFSFKTKNSKLKRELYFYFEEPLIKRVVTKKKYTNSYYSFFKNFH
jgi:hypothetical protein